MKHLSVLQMAADSDTESTPTLLNSIQLNSVKFILIQLNSVSFYVARPACIYHKALNRARGFKPGGNLEHESGPNLLEPGPVEELFV